MSSVKILHCADLHIGAAVSALSTRAQSRRAEALITFEKIIATAKMGGVQIILIAGDLFDSNNIEQHFVDSVINSVAQIPEIKVVFSAGNHDPLNFDSPFKKSVLPKNFFVLDTEDCFVEFDELNTRVYGKSFGEVYMAGSERFGLVPDQNFINLMCIHGELRSDMGSNYNSITASFIENSGMDYIALGHVHKRSEVGKIGNTYCAYCGCSEGLGFDELGEKGVYVGEVSKNSCNLSFVPVAKRMHLCENVDISDMANSLEIAQKVISVIKEKHGENFSENLYKIILCGSINDSTVISVPEITSRLSEQLYFAKVKDKTEIKIDFDELSKENTLKGIFVRRMLEKINAATPEEKQALTDAVNLGLKAFVREVAIDED